MIAGTLILKDKALTFQLVDDAVTYTVCDAFSGEQETRSCSARNFAAALCIALAPDDAMTGATISYARYVDIAEAIMPKNPDLRWIP